MFFSIFCLKKMSFGGAESEKHFWRIFGFRPPKWHLFQPKNEKCMTILVNFHAFFTFWLKKMSFGGVECEKSFKNVFRIPRPQMTSFSSKNLKKTWKFVKILGIAFNWRSKLSVLKWSQIMMSADHFFLAPPPRCTFPTNEVEIFQVAYKHPVILL